MFLTQLDVRHIVGKYWLVIQPLAYSVDGSALITVPVGFRTDFASIPNIAVAIFGRPSGEVAPPSVLHDFLYSTKYEGSINRQEADNIFLQALNEAGVSWFKRMSLYLAVRVRGALFYRKASNDPES